MTFFEPAVLGKTGLKVGRLGLGASYGAPAEAYEEAFEKGCNYFYWTTRKSGMRDAIKNICTQGNRDKLVISIQSYSRSAALMEITTRRALKALGIDHADVLILGWHNRRPGQKVIDKAVKLKEAGLVRFLGISGHNRKLFPKLWQENIFDLFHIRYNAAHRDAEQEVFPHITENHPDIVSYTATRWGYLLKPNKMPPGETVLSAADCYRFALSHPSVDVCLCGPANTDQMREGLRCLELGMMTADEINRMRKIGDFVHHHSMKWLF